MLYLYGGSKYWQYLWSVFGTFGPIKLIASQSKTIFWTSFEFFGLIIFNKSSTRDDNWSSISSINQFVMLRDKKLVWGGGKVYIYWLKAGTYMSICVCVCVIVCFNHQGVLATYWKFVCMLIYYYCLNIVKYVICNNRICKR